MADPVSALVNALQDCLCAALADTPGGVVCRCCPTPGATPPMDTCCVCTGGGNGQASVTVAEIYPTSRFPTRGIGPLTTGSCAAGSVTWAADLLLTVYRCVHTVDEQGQPPTCEQLRADADMIAADAQAMRRAVACCDWRNPGDVFGFPVAFVPGAWRPVDPMGGCAGGRLSVTVDLGADCCPNT